MPHKLAERLEALSEDRNLTLDKVSPALEGHLGLHVEVVGGWAYAATLLRESEEDAWNLYHARVALRKAAWWVRRTT